MTKKSLFMHIDDDREALIRAHNAMADLLWKMKGDLDKLRKQCETCGTTEEEHGDR